MRQLRRTSSRFAEIVQIVNGPLARAVIQRASDMDQPGVEFSPPKVTCRVDPHSLVRTGQVLKVYGDGHYLVGDHSATADYRTHHLFKCDRLVNWTRPQLANDPLTGLPRSTGVPANLGPIWVMWERVRREFVDLTMRMSQERHLVATGAAIQPGDLLDGVIVDRVGTYLGLRIVELQS